MTLSDEQIQDLLHVGNPTDEERRLIRIGWEAAMRTKSAPGGLDIVRNPITEEMHIAAVKVLHRANGVHGLPQRMLDAMLAGAPEAKP